MGLVVILTKPPSHPAVADLMRNIRPKEYVVELFVCGDGVYSILSGSLTCNTVHHLLDKKWKIHISKEDMDARGITSGLLIDGVIIEEAFYDLLVENIMKDDNIPLTI